MDMSNGLSLARVPTDDPHAWRYAHSLIEANLDPVVTLCPEGRITDLNEATIRATGLSRERLIATDFSDRFTEPQQARSTQREVLEKGAVADCPLTIRHENGRQADVLYSASVYRDAAGNVLGVFAIARDARDTGELRAAERQLRAQVDELRRFQKVTVDRELRMRELEERMACVAAHLKAA